MRAEIFNCFAHPYINSFVARMNLAVGQFDLHSHGLSCKGLRKILFYTPSVLEAPRSKFGTAGISLLNPGMFKSLCYGVPFDEIDKIYEIPPLSWGSAFFYYTQPVHICQHFLKFFLQAQQCLKEAILYLQAWWIVHPPSLFAALLLLCRASSLYQAACKLFSFVFIKNNDYKRQKPAYAGTACRETSDE